MNMARGPTKHEVRMLWRRYEIR